MATVLDYDLTILGHSLGAIVAAKTGADQGKRVMLVGLNPPDPRLSPSPGFGVAADPQGWAETLGAWGVDYFAGVAQLTHDRHGYFEFETGLPSENGLNTDPDASIKNDRLAPSPRTQRAWRSSFCLLALPPQPHPPPFPGLDSTPWISALEVLADPPLDPATWVWLGGTPESLEAVFQLACLHRGITPEITLLWPSPTILPEQDPEAIQRLVVYLESLGVQVITGATVQTLWTRQGRIGVTTTKGDYPGDRLGLGWGWRVPALDLGFSRLQPPVDLAHPLTVNPHLQVSHHPRLYATGLCLGGYANPTLGVQEARLVMQNLGRSFPWQSKLAIHYQTLTYDLLSTLPYRCFGWTATQAQTHFGSRIRCLQADNLGGGWATPLPLDAPILLTWLKVVLDSHGQILGAQGLGSRAAGAIDLLAVAQRSGWRWHHIPDRCAGTDLVNLWQILETGRPDF